jgi:hypothetical protein
MARAASSVMGDEALCAIAGGMKLTASIRDISNFMIVLLLELLFFRQS